MSRATLVLACGALVCAAAAHAAAGEAIVLAGGTVHPVSAPAIENGMVVFMHDSVPMVVEVSEAGSKRENVPLRSTV